MFVWQREARQQRTERDLFVSQHDVDLSEGPPQEARETQVGIATFPVASKARILAREGKGESHGERRVPGTDIIRQLGWQDPVEVLDVAT